MNETIASTRAVVYKDQNGEITEIKIICTCGNSMKPVFLEERVLGRKYGDRGREINNILSPWSIKSIGLDKTLPALV